MNNEFLEALVQKIKDSYEQGISAEEAEKLAGEFLHAQLEVSSQLQVVDLDARMKKSALKGLKAATYLNHATKGDKKPSDVLLGAIVDSDKIIQQAQDDLDVVEAAEASLERYLSIFKESHIHFRAISRGTFNG